MYEDKEPGFSESIVKHLLNANHNAFEQHIARITELRALLENEEAKLQFCLYEEKRLLELLHSNRSVELKIAEEMA